MSNLSDLQAAINAKTKDAIEASRNGLTLAGAGNLFTDFTQILVEECRKLLNSGAVKKQTVLDEPGKFFDRLAPAISFPWWAAPFKSIILIFVRGMFLKLADGAIEAIYARMKIEVPE